MLTSPVSTPQARAAELDLPLIGSWPGYVRGPARRVAVAGNHAYVAAGSLQVIDISSPDVPQLVSAYSSEVSDVAISGGYAYLAVGPKGLQVIDIHDPADLRQVGGIDTPGWAHRVTISDGYAYVVDGSTGVQVIDITEPATPEMVGSLVWGQTYLTYATAVAVSGNHAYVAFRPDVFGENAVFQVIDISNPGSPRLVGQYENKATTGGYGTWGVSLSGDYAFLADGDFGLHVIDVSDPVNPHLVGAYVCDDPRYDTLDVKVSGNLAYLVGGIWSWGGKGGLDVIDITNPAQPTRLGGVDTDECATGIALSDGVAYLANGGAGLQVIDIGRSASPQKLGAFATDWHSDGDWGVQQIAVSEDEVYVFANDAGLEVVNIGDPANPKRIGGNAALGYAEDVAISGNQLYAAVRGVGLRVIDVVDPGNPQPVGAHQSAGVARGLAATHTHVFLAGEGSGLEVFDVSVPERPKLVGTYDIGGWGYQVAVSGNYAYYIGNSGFQVLNISDPTSPEHLSGVPPDDYSGTRDLVVSGDHVYLLEYPWDELTLLRQIDVSDPRNPRQLGLWEVAGQGVGLAVSQGYAYISDWSRLLVWDITMAKHIGYYQVQHPWELLIRGDTAFVAAGRHGLQILDLTGILARPRIFPGDTGPNIRWETGNLQFAPSTEGPWTDLPASSPMPLSPIGDKGFFRVKVEE